MICSSCNSDIEKTKAGFMYGDNRVLWCSNCEDGKPVAEVTELPIEVLMTYTQTLELVEAVHELRDIFDDFEKPAQWLVTANPHLGNSAPIDLFILGRGHKVLKFIRNAREENWA